MGKLENKMAFAQRTSRISLSRTQAVLTAAQKLKSEGADVVDLGAGEPDFPTPDNIKRAAKEALDADFTKYTAAAGIAELRAAILHRHRTDFGAELSPAQVTVTVGGKQGLFNLILALVEAGDEVILPAPYWVTFPEIVAFAGGRSVMVSCAPEEGFRLRVEQVEAAMTDRTRVLILNSPCNPTGAVVDPDDLLRLVRLAADREIFVISDECYLHFVYDGRRPFSTAGLVQDYEPWLAIAGSLSKTYAMTGWRVGYCIAPEALIREMVKIQSHSTTHPTSIAQKAAVEALTGDQSSVQIMLAEYQRRRDYLIPALNEIPGMRCSLPGGAFYAFPDVRAFLGSRLKNSTDFCQALLDRAHVALTPGVDFGTDGFVRISYAAAMDRLEEGVRRIREFVASL